MLLHDYIGKQEDLFGEIVEYVNDGYTGTNFNRPAFQKMIVDLKQGDIRVIMVKDLSRLGRDYIGVGDYIEQIFPLMGVRFIAVNNSFDSMKLNNGTPGIEVAVSNLVNNMYSRDIAKKIRAALETNWKNGKATCTNVPFGYVWNKKGGQRWEIDPEAAPCVKKVFELALSGRNTTQIAYGMNELNLPTPGLYGIDYYARKYVKLSGIFKTIRNTALGSIAIVVCCVLLSGVHLFTVRILADIVISAITYLVILTLLKEEGIVFLLRWTRQRKSEEK